MRKQTVFKPKWDMNERVIGIHRPLASSPHTPFEGEVVFRRVSEYGIAERVEIYGIVPEGAQGEIGCDVRDVFPATPAGRRRAAERAAELNGEVKT